MGGGLDSGLVLVCTIWKGAGGGRLFFFWVSATTWDVVDGWWYWKVAACWHLFSFHMATSKLEVVGGLYPKHYGSHFHGGCYQTA
jgi:hypothetical protein